MDFEIVKANREDMEEILELQYLAYQSEAALFGSRDIPPLKETLEEVYKEYDEGLVLKMKCGSKIIGSVRAREQYPISTACSARLTGASLFSTGWRK